MPVLCAHTCIACMCVFVNAYVCVCVSASACGDEEGVCLMGGLGNNQQISEDVRGNARLVGSSSWSEGRREVPSRPNKS